MDHLFIQLFNLILQLTIKMDHTKTLELMLSALKGQRKTLNNELKRLPKGTLMISSNGKRLSIFNIGEPYSRSHPKGIGKDKELVAKLARKAYIMEQLRRINTDIALLEKLLKRNLPLDTKSLLKAMPKHFDALDSRKLIQPADHQAQPWPNPSRSASLLPRHVALFLEGMTPQEWAVLPYKENTKNLEHKIHRTNRGFYARSKSEVLITGEYDCRDLFYHYDEVIEIDGQYVSPDVIGLRSDGAFIFHEHLGLQDMSYSGEMIRKLITYRKGGIILGKNLFFTYDDESGGINMEMVRASIDAMFFPGFLP